MEKHKSYGPYEKSVKRILDLVLSGLAIILLSWLMIIIAILVRFKLGSPVLFRQERPGKDGKSFYMYKFRSMTDERDGHGVLLPNEFRMIKFGKILRKLSLDELPELFNIFLGDMSIIGPRPLMVRYLPYYTKEEMHRHDVRPGLTGMAQVNGRSFITWEEIFEYDLKYVNKITFMTDLKILLLTVLKVFKREDIADFSETVRDKDGNLYAVINGEHHRIHEALDVERGIK